MAGITAVSYGFGTIVDANLVGSVVQAIPGPGAAIGFVAIGSFGVASALKGAAHYFGD